MCAEHWRFDNIVIEIHEWSGDNTDAASRDQNKIYSHISKKTDGAVLHKLEQWIWRWRETWYGLWWDGVGGGGDIICGWLSYTKALRLPQS